MGYVQTLPKNTAIMDETPVEIPFDLFRCFVRPDELEIVAESIGFSRISAMGKDEQTRYYSGHFDGVPRVAIETVSNEYHVFTIDNMEKPFSEKNMFYWCGLYLEESWCYGVKDGGGNETVVRVVEWIDGERCGKGKSDTFQDAVREAMIQQMNLKPVSKSESENVK